MNELKELVKYAHNNYIEIEIFAHGALCESYSGHCLLSSFKGGRSGNRGTCAQPCRESYDLIMRDNEGKGLLNQKVKENIFYLQRTYHYLKPI